MLPSVPFRAIIFKPGTAEGSPELLEVSSRSGMIFALLTTPF